VRRRRDAGFTLLELLVSLMVFAVLAALVYGTVRMGSRSWQAGAERIDEADALRIGWSFVQGALAASRPVPAEDAEATGVLFRGATTAVEFVAELPAYLGTGGLHVLNLRLDRDAEGSGRLVLRRTPFDPGTGAADPEAAGRAQEVVLVEGVEALAIQYYGVAGDDEGPRWHAEWKQEEVLPTLVRADVALEGGGRWPVLAAHLRFRRAPAASSPVGTNGPAGAPARPAAPAAGAGSRAH
jgi:general secretion pathway protein J